MNTQVSVLFAVCVLLCALNLCEAQFGGSFSQGGGFQDSGRRGQFFRGGFQSGPNGVSAFGGGGSFSSHSTSSGANI